MRTRARGGKEHGRTLPTHPKKRLLVLRETPRLLLNRFRKTIPHAQIAAGLEQLTILTRVTFGNRDDGRARKHDRACLGGRPFLAQAGLLQMTGCMSPVGTAEVSHY